MYKYQNQPLINCPVLQHIHNSIYNMARILSEIPISEVANLKIHVYIQGGPEKTNPNYLRLFTPKHNPFRIHIYPFV